MQRRSTSIIALFALPIAAALVFGVGAARKSAPASSPLTLQVDLSNRILTVRRDGEVVKTYGVAIGSEAHPTPTGSFGIQHLIWNPAWIPPDSKWARGKTYKAPGQADNPMRTVKLFFREPDFFIHGTNSPGSIGEAASHGCLRMKPDEAAELALMVMDNGGVTRDWDWVKGILNLGESRSVWINTAAPLTIVP